MRNPLDQTVSWLWTPISKAPPPSFTEDSILIAVMGMTGAGKTTFISSITGLDMDIGHGLKSCTKDVQIATMKKGKQVIHLIDTPGFDDTDLKDSDILIKIAKYLMNNVRLSGILYLHPITTSRIGGAASRNLEMFKSLVGESNMGNVRLVTTKWNVVTPEQGQAWLQQLRQEFWCSMIAEGAKVERCDDPTSDGLRIVNSILGTSSVTLQFQDEINDGLQLRETTAAKVVVDQLDKAKRDRETEIRALREQLETMVDRTFVENLQRRCDEKLREQEEAAEEVRKLQKSEIDMLRKENEELKRSGGCVIL